MKKIIISNENSNVRLDKFLSSFAKASADKKQEVFLNSETTRGEIIRKIKAGEISVNNKKVKPSYVLRLGDKIISNFSAKGGSASGGQFPISKKISPNSKIKIKIIYQDGNIIVVDKPAGVSAHPCKSGEKDTLVNFLVYKFPEIRNIHDDSKDAELRPGIVHRLDKDTSGVMVITRNMKAFQFLKKLFKEHKVEKKYLAIVYGKLENKSGIISKPIARAKTYRKQVIAGRKTKTKIREAVTHYKVLKEFSNYSLLEVTPKTGRMHQIRIHLFSIGHPVVGDKIYKLKKVEKIEAPRQLLHAQSIKFRLFGKNFIFSANIPKDIAIFAGNID